MQRGKANITSVMNYSKLKEIWRDMIIKCNSCSELNLSAIKTIIGIIGEMMEVGKQNRSKLSMWIPDFDDCFDFFFLNYNIQ